MFSSQSNANSKPHLIILGAGASIASYYDWGASGPVLPSMNSLAKDLGLSKKIEKYGLNPEKNFEDLYSEICESGEYDELVLLMKSRIVSYFSKLRLPDTVTVYDKLILSLRDKDCIATFNWDPFLIQAWNRNYNAVRGNVPHLLFLHGNVGVNICDKCRRQYFESSVCRNCGNLTEKVDLLYPVKNKNYASSEYLKIQWSLLSKVVSQSYLLTIFGYSAPKTDIEARKILLSAWSNNSVHEFAETEIVDIADKRAVEKNWKDFLFSHHYSIHKNINNSWLLKNPRRSCDSFSGSTLHCRPWDLKPMPRFKNLKRLHTWIMDKVEEEIKMKNGKINNFDEGTTT